MSPKALSSASAISLSPATTLWRPPRGYASRSKPGSDSWACNCSAANSTRKASSKTRPSSKKYYKTNGYLDVRVTRELQFTDDHQFVDVVFHITEGLRYHVQGIGVKGTQALPQDQVLSIVQVHKGDLYDERVVEKDVRNIQDLYGYRGYPVAVQKDLVFADPKVEPGVVRIQYQVIERKPRKVGEVLIDGNEITKARVVGHFLPGLLPGQTLSYPAMRDDEKLLARSNLFDQEMKPTVSVIDRNDNPESEYADVLVRVKETMTGSLMFGASINSDSSLVGSIVLNERNFDLFRPPTCMEDVWEGKAWRGGGEEFRLEAVPGTVVQRVLGQLPRALPVRHAVQFVGQHLLLSAHQ